MDNFEGAVLELNAKLDEVRAAVDRVERRLASLEAQEAGVLRTERAHIVRIEGMCGGRPLVQGTRITVKAIVGWTRLGLKPEQIAEQYDLTLAQVADAFAYYKDHPEEIDAEFAEEQRHLQVEIPRLQRMIAERRAQSRDE